MQRKLLNHLHLPGIVFQEKKAYLLARAAVFWPLAAAALNPRNGKVDDATPASLFMEKV